MSESNHVIEHEHNNRSRTTDKTLNRFLTVCACFLLLVLPCQSQVGGPYFPGPGTPAAHGGITVTPNVITASTGSFSAPYNLTFSTSVPAGDFVVFTPGTEVGTDPLLVVTDTQNNCGSGYTKVIFQGNSGDSVSQMLFYCQLTTGVTTSDHLHVAVTTDSKFGWIASSVHGVAALDTDVGNNITTGSATLTTGTYAPGVSAEAVFAACTQGAGTFSAYGNVIGTAATGIANTPAYDSRTTMAEYRVISTNTSGTGTFTFSVNFTGGACVIAGFK